MIDHAGKLARSLAAVKGFLRNSRENTTTAGGDDVPDRNRVMALGAAYHPRPHVSNLKEACHDER